MLNQFVTANAAAAMTAAEFGQGIPALTKLAKIYTPEAYKAAADFVQGAELTDLKGTAKHDAAVTKFIQWLELADDNVKLIPFAGPLLATTVDSQAVDKLEADFVEWVFNLIAEKIRELIETAFQFIFKI